MTIPIEKIIEAARKTGFGSELKIAAIMVNAGWQTDQNVYYIDKDENKGRELDVYAYKIFRDASSKVNCHINLCIEVKSNAEPFIFFQTSRAS